MLTLIRLRILHVAAVEPDSAHAPVCQRYQRDESVLSQRVVQVRNDGRTPGLATILRSRDVHVVRVGAWRALHQPVGSQRAIWHGDYGGKVSPVNKPVLAFANRAHFGPTVSVPAGDRKSTRLNSSHSQISYAVFCL